MTLEKGVLNIPQFRVQLESEDNLTCALVYLAEDTVIPGSTETFVKCNLRNSSFRCLEGIMVPHFDRALDQNSLSPKSLVNVNDGNIIFSVFNPNKEPMKIKKNTQVAIIQSILCAVDLVNNHENQTHTDIMESECLRNHLKIMMKTFRLTLQKPKKMNCLRF